MNNKIQHLIKIANNLDKNESAKDLDQIMSAEDLAAKYNLPLLDENGNQIN